MNAILYTLFAAAMLAYGLLLAAMGRAIWRTLK
jgi:hypothetical protein